MDKICVSNLYFNYYKNDILKNINFSVEKGALCALLGPNGSGKTTLLKSIMGLRKPLKGDIFIDGIPLKNMTIQSIGRMVSMVHQQTSVVFPYTVLEMVLLGKSPALGWTGVPNKEDILNAKKLLKQMDIDYLTHRVFNELSGGEKQIVMFARALFQNTEVLLLDEPTSQLDFKNQFYILDLVKEISLKRGLTTIITLHNPNLASRYCNKVVMLKNGELIYEGSNKGGFSREKLVNLYNMEIQVEKLKNGNKIILPINW